MSDYNDYMDSDFVNIDEVETIFDHNPTKEELEEITSSKDKETYVKRGGFFSQTKEYAYIALLYHKKGNKKMFEKYKKMAPEGLVDEKMRRDFSFF